MSTTPAVRQPAKSAVLAVSLIFLLIALTIVALLFSQQEDMRPFSPHSTLPNGAGALNTLLENEGISVTMAGTPADAARLADKHSTVLLTPQATAFEESVAKLTQSAAGIVVTGTGTDLTTWGFPGSSTLAIIEAISAGNCANPNAAAAEEIGPINSLYVTSDDFITYDDPADICFTTDAGAAWVRSSEYPNVTLMSDPQFFSNENLDKYGNAAFALRELGSQPKLIWVIGKDRPVFTQQKDTVYTDWMVRILMGLLGVAAVYACYRGRRFGPLVAEPLPVHVPVSEADTGRARLYERANDLAYFADILRANTLTRICPRIGLPPHSSPEDVVSTLSSISKIPDTELTDLLYKRRVTTKKELTELTTQLEYLERKFNAE